MRFLAQRRQIRDLREADRFCLEAARRTTDASTRKLLGDLATAEAGQQVRAGSLAATHLDEDARATEDRSAHRQFVLTWVQPGLAGLMDTPFCRAAFQVAPGGALVFAADVLIGSA